MNRMNQKRIMMNQVCNRQTRINDKRQNLLYINFIYIIIYILYVLFIYKIEVYNLYIIFKN